MSKGTKSFGHDKALACESRGFVCKKRGCVVLTHPHFKNEICQPDDNPPIGIVLGAKKDELLMEYALQGIDNQLFAARYQLYLPNREELQAQLDLLLDNTKEKK